MCEYYTDVYHFGQAKGESINVSELPTSEEYRAQFNISIDLNRYSEPKYQCPKCDGGMCRNETITLASYPVQYQYKCNKCGHVETQFG